IVYVVTGYPRPSPPRSRWTASPNSWARSRERSGHAVGATDETPHPSRARQGSPPRRRGRPSPPARHLEVTGSIATRIACRSPCGYPRDSLASARRGTSVGSRAGPAMAPLTVEVPSILCFFTVGRSAPPGHSEAPMRKLSIHVTRGGNVLPDRGFCLMDPNGDVYVAYRQDDPHTCWQYAEEVYSKPRQPLEAQGWAVVEVELPNAQPDNAHFGQQVGMQAMAEPIVRRRSESLNSDVD